MDEQTNMSGATVIQRAENLKRTIRDDLPGSYNTFLDFIRDNTTQPQLLTEAIILGSRLFERETVTSILEAAPRTRQHFIDEASQLIDKVVDSAGIEETRASRLAIRETRQHFLEKKPVEDLVFEGNRLTKKYRGGFCLRPLDLQLRLGEITGVVGQNGNGKSTLLKIIAGQLKLDGGKLHYPLFCRGKNDWTIIKQSVGYIGQTLEVFGSAIDSIRRQLEFTAAIKGIRGAANKTAVEYTITLLGLEEFADSRWSNLSGGYKIRFELARQLVWNPKLLVLDEPLANLDIKSRDIFLADLRNLANSIHNSMAIVLSSQNLYDVEKIADRLVFFRDGQAIFNGPPAEIGLDRMGNCYEIDTNADPIAIRTALNRANIRVLKNEANNKLIYTEFTTTPADILSALLADNIRINYFRDISHSSRILFEK